MTMILRSALALFLSLRGGAALADRNDLRSEPSWRKFGSNVNYRITAVIDVNGGADAGPNFESFASDDGVSVRHAAGDGAGSESSTGSVKTPGYSVPVDVLTLRDADGRYRQRVGYYGGTQVDYNNNGEGYKVVPVPYSGKRNDAERGHDPQENVCFETGGSSTDVGKQEGYLNFFPTVEQMEHYTLGKLITDEPGIPYRVATLEAPHGSYDATSTASQPDASYDAHPGMPSDDWFQFHYEESLSPNRAAGGAVAARPLKWTMLARNQIINSHTENWVVRYLSYEAIEGDDDMEMWEGWFDSKFREACGEGRDRFALADAGRDNLQLNRLGMFLSTSSHSPGGSLSVAASPPAKEPSRFDLFLARNNRHYPHADERSKREATHDSNADNIEKWNREHAGKTKFAPNEFLDLDVKEVMKFRGGHVPHDSRSKTVRRVGLDENKRNLRSAISESDGGPNFLFGDVSLGSGNEKFTTHQVPKDFDPSTLPESFDWREHSPGSVSPVKDQGFCGSCWAFSFVSALESHWYIAHGQSVDLPEQFVNDCAWSDAAHACDGGDAAFAAKDIINKFQGRVPKRDAYGGYLSVDGACYLDILQDMGMMDDDEGVELSSTAPPSAVQLTDWVLVPPRDDIATKHALFTKGPLAIALNVVDEALYYADGVLDVESCEKHGKENLDHAINLVGWGVDELPGGGTAEHWILRNSWSDLWGDAGYFRVRMGDRDCGVTTSVGYPAVPKAGGLGVGPVGLSGKVSTS